MKKALSEDLGNWTKWLVQCWAPNRSQKDSEEVHCDDVLEHLLQPLGMLLMEIFLGGKEILVIYWITNLENNVHLSITNHHITWWQLSEGSPTCGPWEHCNRVTKMASARVQICILTWASNASAYAPFVWAGRSHKWSCVCMCVLADRSWNDPFPPQPWFAKPETLGNSGLTPHFKSELDNL